MIGSSRVFAVFAAVAMSALAACAPPGFEGTIYTTANWPSADQEVGGSARLEIETLLRRLGYLGSRPDGVIGRDTRAAIRAYQTDVGVTPTGFVSVALLESLRVNAGGAVPTAQPTPAAPAPRATPAQPTTRPSPASGGGSDDDDSGGGGGGGGGGGAWD